MRDCDALRERALGVAVGLPLDAFATELAGDLGRIV
jgi:hypothetical protein